MNIHASRSVSNNFCIERTRSAFEEVQLMLKLQRIVNWVNAIQRRMPKEKEIGGELIKRNVFLG
jgi:hypothetical protein